MCSKHWKMVPQSVKDDIYLKAKLLPTREYLEATLRAKKLVILAEYKIKPEDINA